MKDIIAVINQKGGVGKSTTAFMLGKAFASKGFKILFIDLDAQSNLSYTMKAKNTASSDITSLELLIGKVKVPKAIQHTKQGDIIASSPSLALADSVILETGKEYRLKKTLADIYSSYDYILIDTPPALGILTVNALTACTGAIIPAQADIYSLQGISQLYKTISAVKEYSNPSLKVMGILLTRYTSRTIISREVADMINETAKHFQTKLYKTKIRECTAIKESQIKQTDIFKYAPNSNAAIDYKNLANEIIREEK
jgi:chromosome partitioning protein